MKNQWFSNSGYKRINKRGLDNQISESQNIWAKKKLL